MRKCLRASDRAGSSSDRPPPLPPPRSMSASAQSNGREGSCARLEGPKAWCRRRPSWARCRTQRLQLHGQVRALLARMAADARRRLRCGGGSASSPSRPSSCCARAGGGCGGLQAKLPHLLDSTLLPPLHDDDAEAVVDAGRAPPPLRRDSLSEALRPALAVAQVFLVLPVRAGRWSRRARTAALLAVMLAVIALAAVHMFRSGISLPSSAPLVFYGTAALSVHLLAKLSVHWPRLSGCWSSSGSLLTEGLEDERRTARTCRLITVTMLALAAVEHILSMLNGLMPLLVCAERGGAWAVYKSLFLNMYPMIFEVLPFSVPASLLVVYLNVTCTFVWNFIDLLVVAVSYSLATRFKTFAQFLRQAKGKDYSIFWWQEVREAYNRLSLLTKRFDDHINAIVLLSFASNLYFICLQLLYNMTRYENDGVFASVYFYFSFAWVLTRAALVAMSAASVYEQAAAPTEVLYCVPSKSFNAEVQRFLIQTTTDTVALSGARFFWVTRSLVLTLAGTVATYEIVLVQFHDDVDKVQRASVCFPW